MRLAVDTGGTFTDLVVEEDDGRRWLYKRPSTPHNPLNGVLAVLGAAAADRRCDRRDLLTRADLLIYATTRAINAVITGTSARTALLTTDGHPEILVFREGGRSQPFNHRREYPPPYIPRRLTWEVPERIDAQGRVLRALDEDAVRLAITAARRRVAWSPWQCACCGRSPTPTTSCASATCSTSICPASPTRSRTVSTPPFASTAARPRLPLMRR